MPRTSRTDPTINSLALRERFRNYHLAKLTPGEQTHLMTRITDREIIKLKMLWSLTDPESQTTAQNLFIGIWNRPILN